MKKIELVFVFLIAMVAVEPVGWASRTVIVPVYSRRHVGQFDPAVPAGTKSGTIMSVKLHLSNLSSIVQTGSIELLKGTSAHAQSSPTLIFDYRLILCGAGVGAPPPISSGAYTGRATFPSNLPSPVNFRVGASGNVTLSAWVFFTSADYHEGIAASFSPLVKLMMNEDRGAVIASMIPENDGPTPGFVFCDGTPAAGHRAPKIGDDRSGVPLLINGGRPF